MNNDSSGTGPSHMTEEMKNMLDGAKDAALSHNERAALRNQMRLFMVEHPASAPLRLRILDRLSGMFEVFETVHARALVPSALAFMLVVGIGTSYAAESALPGDPLYVVKIRINEPVQGALATSQAEKAKWNAERMSRRLEEAEQLASEGKLTPVARASIQSQIAISSADFNVNLAELAKSDDAAGIAQVQSNLEASLSGHEQVLSALADRKEDRNIARILESVASRKEVAASGRSNAEAKVSNKQDARTKAAALSTKKEADRAVREVKAAIVNAIQTGATSTLVARASAATAEQSISAGDEKFENGEYGAAFRTFQSAVRTAESAQVRIDAQMRLKDDLTVEATTSQATSTSDEDD